MKGKAYYEQKKVHIRQRSEAQKTAKVDDEVKEKLKSFGY